MWANEEPSKELFELSGWLDPMADGRRATPSSPYYSLGFILRKLPEKISLDHGVDGWNCYHYGFSIRAHADTPEDAACRLAIELFKQGILTSPNQALKKGEQ